MEYSFSINSNCGNYRVEIFGNASSGYELLVEGSFDNVGPVREWPRVAHVNLEAIDQHALARLAEFVRSGRINGVRECQVFGRGDGKDLLLEISPFELEPSNPGKARCAVLASNGEVDRLTEFVIDPTSMQS